MLFHSPLYQNQLPGLEISKSYNHGDDRRMIQNIVPTRLLNKIIVFKRPNKRYAYEQSVRLQDPALKSRLVNIHKIPVVLFAKIHPSLASS